MYQDYLEQYDPDLYILPTSYEDFLQNYLQEPVFNPLADLDYYSGTEYYESLEDAVRGTGLYYYPITEFDWWNVPPFPNPKIAQNKFLIFFVTPRSAFRYIHRYKNGWRVLQLRPKLKSYKLDRERTNFGLFFSQPL